MVVSDGETWIEVPVTAPRPLIESEVALATDQESVALPPPAKGEIDTGEAVKEEIAKALFDHPIGPAEQR